MHGFHRQIKSTLGLGARIVPRLPCLFAVVVIIGWCGPASGELSEGALLVNEYKLARNSGDWGDQDCTLCTGLDFINEFVKPVLDTRELPWEQSSSPNTRGIVALRVYARDSPETYYVGPIEVGESHFRIRSVDHVHGEGRQRGEFTIERDSVEVHRFTAEASLASSLIESFFPWEGQWILEYPGHIVIDGVDMNEKLKADRVFSATVLGGKLLYMQEIDGAIGLVWDGLAGPLLYERVPHRMCCEYSAFNPRTFDQCLRFFALRDGYWYLVEAGVPTGNAQ
jgi:hypothetical protein